jgi:Lamin Tail Domain
VGLHICQISQKGTDQRGEWVSVANDGQVAVALTDLEITDFTKTQQHVHIFRFPAMADHSPLMLGPNQTAFIFTTKGKNEWVPTPSGKRELHLFAGKSAPVWNNTGDVAYLRNPDGTFIDTMTVGDPARHPNGH